MLQDRSGLKAYIPKRTVGCTHIIELKFRTVGVDSRKCSQCDQIHDMEMFLIWFWVRRLAYEARIHMTDSCPLCAELRDVYGSKISPVNNVVRRISIRGVARQGGRNKQYSGPAKAGAAVRRKMKICHRPSLARNGQNDWPSVALALEGEILRPLEDARSTVS